MKNTKFIKIILMRIIFLIYNLDLTYTINKYIDFIDNLRKKSGLKYTIKYLKAAKLHITRYVCGKPLLSNDAGVALDHEGFPIKFIYFKTLISCGFIRSVFTLLTYSRAIIPTNDEYKKVKPDYSTITNPYKGKE